jgi:hypothetical protein
MLARLDNFPQRHRSVTLHAAAPEVDFGISMRCERIPGRHDPCSRNTPSHACHAKPPAIGLSLAEMAGITRSGQRPARAGLRDWRNACGNCGNPRHGAARPIPRQNRGEGGKVGNPFGPNSGTKVFLGAPLGDARPEIPLPWLRSFCQRRTSHVAPRVRRRRRPHLIVSAAEGLENPGHVPCSLRRPRRLPWLPIARCVG